MSEYRFFLLHKVLVVSVNLLVIVALTVAMYFAAQNPEEFTLIFLKVFGTLLTPIIVLSFLGKRWLRRSHDSVCGDTA